MIDNLNSTKPECPVLFNRLRFAKGEKPLYCGHNLNECHCAPFIHLKCGHVQGDHRWNLLPAEVEKYSCPICRSEGPVVKLSIGMETSYWVDSEQPTHCFDPCGHVASEMTVK